MSTSSYINDDRSHTNLVIEQTGVIKRLVSQKHESNYIRVAGLEVDALIVEEIIADNLAVDNLDATTLVSDTATVGDLTVVGNIHLPVTKLATVDDITLNSIGLTVVGGYLAKSGNVATLSITVMGSGTITLPPGFEASPSSVDATNFYQGVNLNTPTTATTAQLTSTNVIMFSGLVDNGVFNITYFTA